MKFSSTKNKVNTYRVSWTEIREFRCFAYVKAKTDSDALVEAESGEVEPEETHFDSVVEQKDFKVEEMIDG